MAADGGAYDLWVLGPNGFHRHFTGTAAAEGPEIRVAHDGGANRVTVKLRNRGGARVTFEVKGNAYDPDDLTRSVRAGDDEHHAWSLRRSGGWYDLTVRVAGLEGWSRRFAGRVEIGRDSFSDPALGGPAQGEQA